MASLHGSENLAEGVICVSEHVSMTRWQSLTSAMQTINPFSAVTAVTLIA